MRMKKDFYIKGWTPTLVLKQRAGGNSEMAYSILTPKYDIYFRLSGFQSSLLLIHFRYTVQIPVHTVP